MVSKSLHEKLVRRLPRGTLLLLLLLLPLVGLLWPPLGPLLGPPLGPSCPASVG
jgi:hypothetical protein